MKTVIDLFNLSPRLRLVALAVCVSAVLGGPAYATMISDFTFSNVGNKSNLETVEVGDGRRGVLTEAELTGIDVVHFNRGGDGSHLLTPDLVTGSPGTPGTNDRAKLLDEDVALNTGIVNPGGSGGLAADVSYTGSTVGMAVDFESPVTNGLGVDVVLFEIFLHGSGQNPDPFTVSALGKDGDSSKSYGFDTVAGGPSGDYDLSKIVLGGDLGGLAGNITTLTLLETSDIDSDLFVNISAAVVGFDLSDLGVPSGASVTGLFIQDASIDPVYIAGLPVAIPEPSTLALLIGGGLVCQWARRRTLR
jgi:hypothetical protein